MLTPVSLNAPGSVAALPERLEAATLRTGAAPTVARPETERAVPPAGTVVRTAAITKERGEDARLPPPDPDAPTGPPPAFDRSLLEKQRMDGLAYASGALSRQGPGADAGVPTVDLKR